MIYPNGSIEIRKLMKMVDSPEFAVYVEDRSGEPEDWDWMHKGIWRGPLTPIKNRVDLKKWIIPILDEKVELCYDITDEYSKKHPIAGESYLYVKPSFRFEFAGKSNWAIRECERGSRSERSVSLELLKFDEDFEGTCFVVGSWEKNSGGYEFRSCGGRLFEYLDMEDMETVWNALTAGDKYLRKLFEGERD